MASDAGLFVRCLGWIVVDQRTSAKCVSVRRQRRGLRTNNGTLGHGHNELQVSGAFSIIRNKI